MENQRRYRHIGIMNEAGGITELVMPAEWDKEAELDYKRCMNFLIDFVTSHWDEVQELLQQEKEKGTLD